MDAGDIISRLRLDDTEYKRKIGAVGTTLPKTFSKVEKANALAMQKMGREVEGFGRRSKVAADQFGTAWWKRFGQVAVGFTIAYRAMNAIEEGLKRLIVSFNEGLTAIDDFRMGIAEAAASLMMLTKTPTTEHLEAYLKFAESVFRRLEIVAAEHFATGQDLQIAYAKLLTLGIVPATDAQVKSMAQVVDLVMMTTRGLDKERQIRTEIQALAEGQLRPTSVVARLVEQRVDGYREIVDAMTREESAAERTKMFFEMLDPVLKSVGSVSAQILDTHTAWKATLDAVIKRIQRAGLWQMYEDILDSMIAIRDATLKQGELTETGIKLAYGYHLAWDITKTTILGIWDVLVKINALWDEMTFHMSPILHFMKALAMGVTVIKAGLMSWAIILRHIVANLYDVITEIALQPKRFVKEVYESMIEPRYYEGIRERMGRIVEKIERLQTEGAKWYEQVLAGTTDVNKLIEMEKEDLAELTAEYAKWADTHKKTFSMLEGILTKVHAILPSLSTDLEKLTTDLEGTLEKIALWGTPEDLEKFKVQLKARLKALDEYTAAFLKSLTAGTKTATDMEKLRIIRFKRMLEGELADRQSKILSDAQYTYEERLKIIDKFRLKEDEKRELRTKALMAYNRKVLVIEGDLHDGLIRALDDYVAESRTGFENAYYVVMNFAKSMEKTMSNVFFDSVRSQLKSFGEYWKSFFDSIYRIFSDVVSQMITKWIMAQMAMQAATRAGLAVSPTVQAAAATPWTAIVAGGAMFMFGLMANAMNRSKREAEALAAAFRALDAKMRSLSDTWDAARNEIIELLYATSEYERTLRGIDARFDNFKETLKDLGATIDMLTWLEEERAKALEQAEKQFVEQFLAPLEERIAKITMGPTEHEMYMLDRWYENQLEQARLLGTETVSLLREAYELAKKELVLKQQEFLLSERERLSEVIVTLGMTPIELQIHYIEKARDDLAAVLSDIENDIIFYTEQITKTEAERIQLLTDLAQAEVDWAAIEKRWASASSSFQRMVDLFTTELGEGIAKYLEEGLIEEELKKAWPEFASFWAEQLEVSGKDLMRFWQDPKWKSVREEFWQAETAHADALSNILPLIETIPTEIGVLDAALINFRLEVARLTEELETTGETAVAAYVAQIAALTDTFLGSLAEIIRSHTMSDYELALHDLNRWYEEQCIAALALGLSLDLVNEAYELQLAALEKSLGPLANFTNTLRSWYSLLKSLESQILEIETSLQNPLDILERMSILEAEITEMLGAGWREGIISAEHLTAEEVAEVQRMLGNYLDMAAEAYQRPSAAYQSIYDNIVDVLSSIVDEIGVIPESLVIEEEQLMTLKEMRDILDDILTSIGGSLQGGIERVPRTGLYKLHEGERVTAAGFEEWTINLTINEARTPRETALEARHEIEDFMRSPRGGKIIKERAGV